MAAMTVTEMMILAAAVLVLSVAALWIAGALLPPRRDAVPAPPAPATTTAITTFLLHDGALVDTDADEDVLPPPPDDTGDDWAQLARWLAPRFALPTRPAEGTGHLATQDPESDPATLEIDTTGPRTRVTLCDPRATCPATRHALLARRAERARRGAALDRVPVPVWLRDGNGRVIWENAAAAALPPGDRAQLLPATGAGRVALDDPPRWFDLGIEEDTNGTLIFATDVTPLVRAEEARRDFVQTLGRSFADLPTGLAVFDSTRRLAMFNPALTDLTGLDPVFLSARPEIFAFFDMLRDRQVMPEPRNYSGWRGQIHAMIDAAHNGQYREVWSLVTGRTYRVTGRPHPDGAVAFLIEDISDEVSATRHQRAERDTLLAALDRVDDAIAVLSREAGLVVCNRRFATLMRLDPGAREAGLSLDAVIGTCRARLPDDALWQGVAARLDTAGPAQAVTGQLATDTGRALTLSLVPIVPGQMMLTLRRSPAAGARPALSA
ncbi:PAS-domain containing protein [Roseovarius ramblicola]|uniref:PAS-domain containing protein n=1 Tax=Roseovarius ramblicola TaxID=2022336 RepID=A0ABV5I2H1_9RHOB